MANSKTQHLHYNRLASDDDGHWYVIPASRASEFDHWLSDVEDESDITVPQWAIRLDGGPESIRFGSCYEVYGNQVIK